MPRLDGNAGAGRGRSPFVLGAACTVSCVVALAAIASLRGRRRRAATSAAPVLASVRQGEGTSAVPTCVGEDPKGAVALNDDGGAPPPELGDFDAACDGRDAQAQLAAIRGDVAALSFTSFSVANDDCEDADEVETTLERISREAPDHEHGAASAADDVGREDPDAAAPRSQRETPPVKPPKLQLLSTLMNRMCQCFEKERWRLEQLRTAVSQDSAIPASNRRRRAELLRRNEDILDASLATLTLRALIRDPGARARVVRAVAKEAMLGGRGSATSPLLCLLAAKEIMAVSVGQEGEELQVPGEVPLLDDATICAALQEAATPQQPLPVLSNGHRLAAQAMLAEALLHQAIIGGGNLCTPSEPVSTPFYLADAFYHLGALIEQAPTLEDLPLSASLLRGASAAAYAAACRQGPKISLIFLPDERLRGMPAATAAYVRSLECSAGDHKIAWHALASVLPSSSVCLLGREFSEAQCYGENIRCNGGVEACTVLESWYSLALCLRFDTRKEEDKAAGGGSRTEELLVAKRHFRFLDGEAPNGGENSDFIGVDRRDCLMLLLQLDQTAIPQAWVELGSCMRLGFKTLTDFEAARFASEDRAIDDLQNIDAFEFRTVDEEKADVGGMQVSKVDCFSLAISLDPANPQPWFRAALSLEDDVKCRHEMAAARAQRGVTLRIDPRVYERVLGSGDGTSMRRVDALVRALSLHNEDPKMWFALGTTLLERSRCDSSSSSSSSSGNVAKVCISKQMLRSCQVGEAADEEEGGERCWITGETCFAQCVGLSPAFQRLVSRWKAQNGM